MPSWGGGGKNLQDTLDQAYPLNGHSTNLRRRRGEALTLGPNPTRKRVGTGHREQEAASSVDEAVVGQIRGKGVGTQGSLGVGMQGDKGVGTHTCPVEEAVADGGGEDVVPWDALGLHSRAAPCMEEGEMVCRVASYRNEAVEDLRGRGNSGNCRNETTNLREGVGRRDEGGRREGVGRSEALKRCNLGAVVVSPTSPNPLTSRQNRAGGSPRKRALEVWPGAFDTVLRARCSRIGSQALWKTWRLIGVRASMAQTEKCYSKRI